MAAATETSPDAAGLSELRRPVHLGLSVGHPRGTRGSIGPFVTLPGGGVGFISTASVLAPPGARKGDYIHQPGPRDIPTLTGGSRAAVLTEHFTVLSEATPNEVDAAIAALLDDVASDGNVIPPPSPDAGGHIAGAAEPDAGLLGAEVAFVGRSSGFSAGVVTAVALDAVRVGWGSRSFSFVNCIEVARADRPFSHTGDAGALVYRRGDLAALGLVFAAAASATDGPARSYVLPLAPALRLFGVALA